MIFYIQEHQNWAPRASKMRSKFSGRKAHRGEVHSNRSTSSIWKSHHEKKINDVCPQINKTLPQTLHNSGKISQISFLEPSEEPLGTLPWNTLPFPKHLFLFFVFVSGVLCTVQLLLPAAVAPTVVRHVLYSRCNQRLWFEQASFWCDCKAMENPKKLFNSFGYTFSSHCTLCQGPLHRVM